MNVDYVHKNWIKHWVNRTVCMMIFVYWLQSWLCWHWKRDHQELSTIFHTANERRLTMDDNNNEQHLQSRTEAI